MTQHDTFPKKEFPTPVYDVGQEVIVPRSDGSMDDGWTVEQIHNDGTADVTKPTDEPGFVLAKRIAITELTHAPITEAISEDTVPRSSLMAIGNQAVSNVLENLTTKDNTEVANERIDELLNGINTVIDQKSKISNGLKQLYEEAIAIRQIRINSVRDLEILGDRTRILTLKLEQLAAYAHDTSDKPAKELANTIDKQEADAKHDTLDKEAHTIIVTIGRLLRTSDAELLGDCIPYVRNLRNLLNDGLRPGITEELNRQGPLVIAVIERALSQNLQVTSLINENAIKLKNKSDLKK